MLPIYITIICTVLLSSILIIATVALVRTKRKSRRLREEQQLLQQSLDQLNQQKAAVESALSKATQTLAQTTEASTAAQASLDQLTSLIQQAVNERNIQIDNTEQIISQLNKRKEEATAATNSLIKNQTEYIDSLLSQHYNQQLQEYQEGLDEARKILIDNAREEISAAVAANQAELEHLTAEINDFRVKQKIINEEILRRRELEEKTDFYRICLEESAIHDIAILQSIRMQLSQQDSLNKLIYDNYISKPTLEMVKRILKGDSPSGIYKITRLKTGEIYIGRSVDVKARWIQHVKSAYHVGTIAHSILHTTMAKDGIENFTFELLERVPKADLGTREKYWIDFYGSNSYGLNEKAGG